MTDDEIVNFLGCHRSTVWRAFTDMRYQSQIAITVRMLKNLVERTNEFFKDDLFLKICGSVIEKAKQKETETADFAQKCLRQRNRLMGEHSRNDTLLNIIEMRKDFSEKLFLDAKFLDFCKIAFKYTTDVDERNLISTMRSIHEYVCEQGAGRHIIKDKNSENIPPESVPKREAI